ncbi:alpha/beta hydrolase, partial [Rhodopirellula sp. UBA1907]
MIRLPIPGTILLVASHWFLLPSLADAAPPAQTAAATRLMQKFDKNDNGAWEQNENSRAWNRYRKLDTNQDKILSIDELSQERTATLDTDGERKLDLVYKTVGQKELLLDLYYPAKLGSSEQQTDERPTDERCPVIVYTHGGGWAAGSKQGAAKGSFKTVFEQLLQQGFAVASVNYRLCKPNSGVMMRDCVIDSKDAVRYLAKNSQTLRLDPTRFFVMGDSAGGQIAQMLLLTTS